MSVRTRAEEYIGVTISHYKITHFIGAGGVGWVFLGEDLNPSQQPVAIKVLKPPADDLKPPTDKEREQVLRRFAREISLQKQLHHAHILPVLETGEFEGEPYIIMPFIGEVIEGQLHSQTLEDRIAQANPMPLEEVERLFTQLAAAVQEAHLHAVIHRDIKPNNILLDSQDHIYLADFGIARVFQQATTKLTTTTGLKGVLEYIAPEQLFGSEATPASDQYSLAAVLYEMITGQMVYGTNRAVDGSLKPPAALRPDLPAEADAALQRALKSLPGERFPSVERFAEAFGRGMRGESAIVPSIEPPNPIEQPQPTAENVIIHQDRRAPSRKAISLAAAVLAVVLLVGLVSGLIFSVPGHNQSPTTANGGSGGTSPIVQGTTSMTPTQRTGAGGGNASPTAIPPGVAPTSPANLPTVGSHPPAATATPTPTPKPPTATPTPTPKPPQTWPETAGGLAHTWTNYQNAGGNEGPSVAKYQTIQIACKITGFKVADGDTWWYRIAQSPWNNAYYVSADAFYNNGATSGPLGGTPSVDPAVRTC